MNEAQNDGMISLVSPPVKLVRICGQCKQPYDVAPGPDPGCPSCGGKQAKLTRFEFIRMVMEQAGNYKNPRKHVVLRNWNIIVDHDIDCELDIPPVGVTQPGDEFWAMESVDDPKLIAVEVLEDRGVEGVFVTPVPRRHVQFLVDRSELKLTSIPFRPLAVKRADLHVWLGAALADRYMEMRKARHAG